MTQSLLTARQLEVVTLIADGVPGSQIGELLGIGERTVSHHLREAQGRLGAVNRSSTIAQAFRLGVLPIGGDYFAPDLVVPS